MLEMEIMDFNCNKEGDYTLEKLFNCWGILALESSPINSYGIFTGASFKVFKKNKQKPNNKKNPNNPTNKKKTPKPGLKT